MLQYVAVCCSACDMATVRDMLQCVAVCCSVLYNACVVMLCVAVCCCVLQCLRVGYGT